MVREIVIIGNPVAGGEALKEIRKATQILQEEGYNVRLLLTRRREDAVSFARTIAGEEKARVPSASGKGIEDLPGGSTPRLVIAAGGDGTYNEVANGLALSPVSMAILPLGTTSVLARELGLPFDLRKALDVALTGKVTTVHLGKVSFENPAPLSRTAPLRTRYFLLMAGIGFDGEVIIGVNERLKRYIGKSAYLLSGIRTLFGYAPRPLTVKAHSFSPHTASESPPVPGMQREKELSAYAVIVGKSARYGGDFMVTPDVHPSDPWLSVFATHGGRRRDLFRYVTGVLQGTHLSLEDVSYFKAEELSVSGKAHVQIDGEYGGTTPVTIGIERDALRLVACP
ncbi:MAG: diacylglycerol kinase family lipid kinase [Alphaproteobacteria bacterium]|uniref:Diacylglycerol kinase family lipid kinase n=1 Tax=Candidatus Nitrobium versatile TaxID=2884831 RepID=A0A953M2K7_9BACT|nr:diacylglycerol kinase family lipid kinase [Candidatus Nitrobium versatile]